MVSIEGSAKIEISPLNEAIRESLQRKLNNKTKPIGSLGEIERIALRIGMIQNTLTPALSNPQVFVFAGDHGVCEEGVSAFPQAVTQQMVANFLAGGAAISVLARQYGMALNIVDAGINGDVSHLHGLQNRKVNYGTHNFVKEAAIAPEDVITAIAAGAGVIKAASQVGCNIALLGEMGIGNTTSAAVLTHLITGAPLSQCVGAGTGLDAAGIQHKLGVIQRALNTHKESLPGSEKDGLRLLSLFGGYEVTMMVGAYLQAASDKMVILVDGFIASAALAIASLINPLVLDYCLFSHGSAEQGHGVLLDYFQRKPILNLDMRLGEGSGSAIAYSLLISAVNLLNQMASFDDAGVSKGD